MISELISGSGYIVLLEVSQNAPKTLCLTVFLLIVLRLEVQSAECVEALGYGSVRSVAFHEN
jgi:hypothetical protein